LTVRALTAIAAIESVRLDIPLLSASHAVGLFPSFRDPKLYKWISAQPPKIPDDLVRGWWCSGDNGPGEYQDRLNLDWAVVRKCDGALIGKLDAEFAKGIVTNLGYVIARQYWGRRYGTEAVGRLVDEVERFGFHEQRAYVTQGNSASVRLLKRLTFVETRILQANDVIRGRPVDDIEFIHRSTTTG
jgi:RimJ/RimL family protein N-acetyltransferase